MVEQLGDTNLWLAISNVMVMLALAFITGYYAWKTRDLAITAHRQFKFQSRPIAKLAVDPGLNILTATIKNEGKTTMLGFSVQVSIKYGQEESRIGTYCREEELLPGEEDVVRFGSSVLRYFESVGCLCKYEDEPGEDVGRLEWWEIQRHNVDSKLKLSVAYTSDSEERYQTTRQFHLMLIQKTFDESPPLYEDDFEIVLLPESGQWQEDVSLQSSPNRSEKEQTK